MLHKILVAIDYSESSYYVFDNALMLAKATGAHLGIMRVIDPDETDEDRPAYLDTVDPYLSGDESDPWCYVGHFEQFEPDLFEGFVTKAMNEGVSTDCVYCFGDPEQTICDFALAWNVDLIVLGRRGRSGIAEFFLGSVSNYALHHAPCSVYVVHNPFPANPKQASGHSAELSL